MKITVVSVIVLAVCIVVAELALEGIRQVASLPWSDSLESAIAAGVGALAWVLIMPRVSRV
jgi:hypothetical protein